MEPFRPLKVRTPDDFRRCLPELEAYFNESWLSTLANFSAFTYRALPDLNWAGFYLFDGQRLRLGPFVGSPACMEILPGRGVCGTAFKKMQPLIVPDVNEFPGHIACDSASRAEMVLPFSWGVFDLDSPSPARFSEEEQEGLGLWVSALLRHLPADLGGRRPWA